MAVQSKNLFLGECVCKICIPARFPDQANIGNRSLLMSWGQGAYSYTCPHVRGRDSPEEEEETSQGRAICRACCAFCSSGRPPKCLCRFQRFEWCSGSRRNSKGQCHPTRHSATAACGLVHRTRSRRSRCTAELQFITKTPADFALEATASQIPTRNYDLATTASSGSFVKLEVA